MRENENPDEPKKSMDDGTPYQLIDLLHQRNVPVVLIGGHAVVYHGYVRSTEDVNVVFLRNAESERNLLSALEEVGATWIDNQIDPATGIERLVPIDDAYVRNTRLMMLVTDLGYLDIFDYTPGLPGVSVQELFDSADEFKGRRIVSLEWLRAMKVASGRPKDLLDLEKLSDEE